MGQLSWPWCKYYSKKCVKFVGNEYGRVEGWTQNMNILCMPGSLFFMHQVVQQKLKIVAELLLKLELKIENHLTWCQICFFFQCFVVFGWVTGVSPACKPLRPGRTCSNEVRYLSISRNDFSMM